MESQRMHVINNEGQSSLAYFTKIPYLHHLEKSTGLS